MKLSLRMFSVLTIVSFLSGFFLSYIWRISYEKIEIQKKKRIENAIKSVYGGANRFEYEEMDGFKFYRVFKNENFLGYAFISKGGGYQGEISVLVGVLPDLKTLRGIKILENVETPGLGSKVAEDFFVKQFRGKRCPLRLNVDIKAITGATISSKAVLKIVNNGVKNLEGVFKK